MSLVKFPNNIIVCGVGCMALLSIITASATEEMEVASSQRLQGTETTLEWNQLPNKHCLAKPTKHATLAIAQSACHGDLNCVGVYKPLGGDGAYFLCDERPADDGAEGDQVWAKSTVTSMAATGDQRHPRPARDATRHLQGAQPTGTSKS